MYQFRALPFGLSVSPYVFTQNSPDPHPSPRYSGSRLLSVTVTLSLLHSRRLLRIVLDLGFIPNWEKSEPVPVQKFGFLSARFHLESAQIGPSLDRILSFRNALTKLLGAKHATGRQLHSILGQVESMANPFPLGRAFKKPLQWELKESWSQRLDLWDDKIQLGSWFVNRQTGSF